MKDHLAYVDEYIRRDWARTLFWNMTLCIVTGTNISEERFVSILGVEDYILLYSKMETAGGERVNVAILL
jgi:hypothetical protein